MISRRGLFIGTVASLLAAPAIVRAASLMPVKVPKIIKPVWPPNGFIRPEGQTLLKADYPELAARFGGLFSVNATEFQLPDTRVTIVGSSSSYAATAAGSHQACHLIATRDNEFVRAGDMILAIMPRS